MKVDVYVDVLCPWCFIGHRRITVALAGLADRDRVEIAWRSFELSPQQDRVPGPTAAEAMTEWWGERADARIAQIRSLGAAEGLDLNLHQARPVNTFDAHRLLQFASARGLVDHMLESLLGAYHTDGLDIADVRVLRRIGSKAGLDTGEVSDLLAGDAYADTVRADEKRATEHGVTGVPSLVIDGGPPISPIRPPEELARLLERK